MKIKNIKVVKAERPTFAGDWHDKPLRWRVEGPSQEVQMFSTRKDAETYAKHRRNSPDYTEATNRFLA